MGSGSLALMGLLAVARADEGPKMMSVETGSDGRSSVARPGNGPGQMDIYFCMS